MEVIDLFAKRFNDLLDIYKNEGLYSGGYLERLPYAEMYQGIQYFLKGYSFNSVSIFPWFSLTKPSDLLMPGNLLWLASYPNVNLEYVLDTNTGEVVTFDSEHYSLEWPCAVNYEVFFKSLLIILDVKTEMAYKKTFDLEQSVLINRYHECMNLNGHNQKFSVFYEHILGLELNA